MPIIKSAKKKLRQDRKRRVVNLKVINQLKETVKKARKESNKKNLEAAYSIIDQAAKKKIIHKNKAARLKSRLSKGLLKTEKIVRKSAQKHVKH